jgi:hypothetical protein
MPRQAAAGIFWDVFAGAALSLRIGGFYGINGRVRFFRFRWFLWFLAITGIYCLHLGQEPKEDRTLPPDVKKFAGISSRGAEIESGLSVEELASWNAADLRACSIDLKRCGDFFAPMTTVGEYEDVDGIVRRFRPGWTLVKWRDAHGVSALRVKTGDEIEGTKVLAARAETEFAELDLVAERQSIPINDPQATNQWHHAVIGTTNAWRVSAGTKAVKIAMIDDPFQMDHPDLAPNVVPGWDLDRQVAITSAAGLFHSTRGAGLAAAVGGNNIGVAGVSQCAILPISGTNYTISFFYNAIVWAADHGVRVVNASWDIAGSATVNAGGQYLRDQAQGILVVSGANPRKQLSYPNHPFIFAVSMTDALDQTQSAYGDHIDLAAPGWNIFSTTTGSAYEYDTGTSYSAPIVAGVAACLLSINPALTTEQLMGILQSSAVDLGAPGWDPFYGWGRLDFAKAAEMAFATLAVSHVTARERDVVEVGEYPGAAIELWRAPEPVGPWTLLPASTVSTNNGVIRFEDTDALEKAFYKLRVTLP